MALADYAATTRVVQVVDPDANAAGALTSAEIDVTGYYQALLVVNIGTLGSSATLDCKVQAASTTGGSLSDITGAAITQQTQGGTDASDSVVVGRILCNGTDPFWKVITTVGTATSDCGVTMILMPYDSGDSDNTTMDFAV
jgi:hypothetical protein